MTKEELVNEYLQDEDNRLEILLSPYNGLLGFLDFVERKEVGNIPEELEEAAKKHSCYDEDCENTFYEPIVRNAFIAGAEWGRKKEQERQERMVRNYMEGLES